MIQDTGGKFVSSRTNVGLILNAGGLRGGNACTWGAPTYQGDNASVKTGTTGKDAI